jgi:endo-1,4-beta-xylanase
MKTYLRVPALALIMIGVGVSIAAAEPAVVPLWTDAAPGSEGKTAAESVRISEGGDHVVSGVHHPSITVYLPKDSKLEANAAVLVIPGGGHRELWMDHEGYNVAQWLADRGIAAFVLKYRLAREPGSAYRVDVESLQDVQRALRLIRSRGSEWQVDPVRLGVMGFSAGGELAALAAARGDDGKKEAVDATERESSQPAFQALIYPGNSKAIQPEPNAPPAFLLCGANDRADISEGLAQAYLRFKAAKVPVELHIYAKAGHGFGIRATNDSASAAWPERFREWMDDSGFLK